MSENVQYQPTAEVSRIDLQDRAVRRLTEWAQSAQAAHQIATTLVQTTFVPDAFRGKPGEATAAILAGLEVGLQPMAALRSFDVIQGQAAPRALTLRAIVQSFGHEMEVVESTATRCRMRGRRRGSQEWQSVTWTIERAQQLKLTSKPNWQNQPQTMLVARCTSELARLIAADAILGLGYSAEEVADGGPAQSAADQAVDPTPATTRTMSRRQPQADAPAPDQPGDEEPPSERTGEQITDAQRRKIFPLFTEAGFDTSAQSAEGKAARLAYIANVVGHEVSSTNDLTVAQASQVIEALISDAASRVALDGPPADDEGQQ
jgi:hypothetical protein